MKKEKTILDEFKDLNPKSNKNIVQFLSMKNAYLLAFIGDDRILSKELENEVLDFFEFFVDNGYLDKTEEARLDNWGENDALIIRIGGSLACKKMMKKIKKEIHDLSCELTEVTVNKANQLLNILWNIKKDKCIVFLFKDGTHNVLDVKKYIPKEMLEAEKDFLYLHFLKAFELDAVIIVRCYNNKKSCDLFSLVISDGEWESMPAEIMKTADMTFGEPDILTEYVEISKYMKVFN